MIINRIKEYIINKLSLLKNKFFPPSDLKEKLKECLKHEIDIWSERLYYDLKKKFEEDINYDTEFKKIAYDILGRKSSVYFCYNSEFNGLKYHVDVELLENTDEYLHIGISIIDEEGWFGFFPISSSFLIYKNGKVDK